MIYDDEEVREDAFESLAAVITEYFGMPDNLTDGCSDWQIVEAVNNPVNPLWVGNFDELPTAMAVMALSPVHITSLTRMSDTSTTVGFDLKPL